MTKQEYYDLLMRSAGDGTFPSVDAEGTCLYRGPNGKKCAIGVLIPDEKYTPHLEGQRAVEVLHLCGTSAPAGIEWYDLCKIQRDHDGLARACWHADSFVASMNSLPCFADVARETT